MAYSHSFHDVHLPQFVWRTANKIVEQPPITEEVSPPDGVEAGGESPAGAGSEVE